MSTKAEVEAERDRLRAENEDLRYVIQCMLDARKHESKAAACQSDAMRHMTDASQLILSALGHLTAPTIPNN